MKYDTIPATITKDHILAARRAEFIHQPASKEAHGIISTLTTQTLQAGGEQKVRTRRWFERAEKQMRKMGEALLYELLDASEDEAAAGFCFRTDHSLMYGDPGRANLAQLRWLRRAWKALGYLEHARLRGDWVELNGEKFGTCGRGSDGSCRMRATPKLLQLARDHGITPENLGDHFKPTRGRGSVKEPRQRPSPAQLSLSL